MIIASWDSEEPPTYLTDQMGSEFYATNPTVPLEQIDFKSVTLQINEADNGEGEAPLYPGGYEDFLDWKKRRELGDEVRERAILDTAADAIISALSEWEWPGA